MKKIRYLIEAFLAYSFFGFISLLGFKRSSDFCGFLARKIGPITSAHKTAKLNLTTVYPEFSQTKIEEILDDMWDNLGRNAGELPHISSLKGKKFKEHVKLSFQCEIPKKNALFVSAHYANWELLPRIAEEYGFAIYSLQRSLNNKLINSLLFKMRKTNGSKGMIEKGISGVRESIKLLKSGENIGVLMDQKLRDGVKSDFMRLDATTSNLPQKLYEKGICEIFFVKLNRLSKTKFEIICYKKDLKNKNITQIINDEFTRWIDENPAEWFWVHNRWDLRRC